MAYTKIPKINGYSLTDFHDFDECKFRFFVRHHLDKKYEIATGSAQMALGVLLDKCIKNIHRHKAYEHPLDKLINVVSFSAKQIREEEESNPRKPNFNSAVVKFIDDDLIKAAELIFRNYYGQISGKFSRSIMMVDFYKYYFKMDDKDYILWGGPDTIEMGDDVIPEVIDYKSRQDVVRGKEKMDMDLMPKIYTLLVSDDLKKRGFEKARFKVKFWQDALENDFSEVFDLGDLKKLEKVFAHRVKIIEDTKEVEMCGGQYCDACNFEKREEFLEELKNKFGLSIMSGEEFLNV